MTNLNKWTIYQRRNSLLAKLYKITNKSSRHPKSFKTHGSLLTQVKSILVLRLSIMKLGHPNLSRRTEGFYIKNMIVWIVLLGASHQWLAQFSDWLLYSFLNSIQLLMDCYLIQPSTSVTSLPSTKVWIWKFGTMGYCSFHRGGCYNCLHY